MTKHDETRCFLSPKAIFGEVPPRGMGLSARVPISKGEVVLVLGGAIVSQAEIEKQDHHFSIQVGEDLFISPIDCDFAFRINHSCDPTVGMSGQISYVALRDIEAGDEITYDYAMTDGIAFEMEDGSIYDEFECYCGTPHCRGRVSGDDWKRPELWDRYGNHFSSYLLHRIDRLKAEAGSR